MIDSTADWTYEAGIAIDLCKTWSTAVKKEIACDIYLFGSAIYQGGDQFDAQNSDLDIVVLFTETLPASERVNRLASLRNHKQNLELSMIPHLHRTNCVEPGVSILPITDFELQANVHKSGSRRFFDRNIFLNLETEELSVSLPNAGVVTIPDENRQALEFVQKIHNEFLAVSSNGAGEIFEFDGPDPMPKAYARFAAQLISEAAEGEWYDTRLGLENLWGELLKRRSESEQLGSLFKTLSIRRGGRGRRAPLSAIEQVLLSEILSDLAMATRPQPLVTWEIRFSGGAESELDNRRLINDLKRLVPDAQIIKVRKGSIIIRLRSSERSYNTLQRLAEFDFLPKFFAVDKVGLTEVPEDREDFEFYSQDPISVTANHIAAWRPKSTENMQESERSLSLWLEQWLNDIPNVVEGNLRTEVNVGDGQSRINVDFLLEFRTTEGKELRIAVELIRLRSRSTFFQNLERVTRLGLPTILVVVGTRGQIDRLRPDFGRFSNLSSQTTIVPVQLDNG
jgi:predicted nucleotidyltransferase